jgi:translocation and assembly module TamA
MPPTRPSRAGIVLAMLAMLGACATADEEDGPLERADTAPVPAIPYDVRISGEMPEQLRDQLLDAAESDRLRERPPASELILRRRAEADLPRLRQMLRAQGYYDGRVDFHIEGDTTPVLPPAGPVATIRELTTAPDAHLVFDVEPGPLYRLGTIKVVARTTDPAFEVPSPGMLGLSAGAPAVAQRVLDAEAELLRLTRKQSRPLAMLGERRAIVDHDTRTLDVSLRVAPGPAAPFGTITFIGDAGVNEQLLRRRLPFATGEPYDPDLVDRGRLRLVETNLFSTVRVQLGEALDAEGRIPLTYEVKPRLHRSIGGGVSYQTDVGPGINAFWEHRNLLSAGERLRIEADLSFKLQELKALFRKPDILMPRLALLADSAARREETDAFDSTSIRAGVGVEHEFTDKLFGSSGVAYRYARIQEPDEETTVGLFSLPNGLDWDFSDDLFDPTKGGRLELVATPFFDTLDYGTRFFKAQITHTQYHSLLDDRRLVLALRGSLGGLAGVERDQVPADERFYSGGGGSVRGIGFQLAGPLDADDKPLGGRSLAELSVELRSRVTETLGGVVFLDGGTVFASKLPDFSDPLRLGAGLGFRYITTIGPLRFDVGFPLDRRAGVDDLFQFYVSIGQAF